MRLYGTVLVGLVQARGTRNRGPWEQNTCTASQNIEGEVVKDVLLI